MSDPEKIVNFPELSAIEAEAAEWIVRLENASPQDYAKFHEWQNRGAAYREAAARLSALWGQFDELSVYSKPFPVIADTGSDGAYGRQGWHRPFRPHVWAYAACLVAVFGAGLGYIYWPEAQPQILHYETDVGGQKNIVLADGTSVTLNTDSQLEVVLTPKRRALRLVRGEAYFEVTHDSARPFTVAVGQQHIRDIGTAFDVRRLDRAVEVSVTKGTVELGAESASGGNRSLGVIAAGNKVIFAASIQRSERLSVPELNRKLSWREGVLVYTGEPLEEVVAEINRYTKAKIELGDEVLRRLPVGGYFAIGKLDAVLSALENNFGVRVVWRDKDHIVLYANATRQRQGRRLTASPS